MFGADFFGFEIILKCMSGSTTEYGKFIMPLSEKLTYPDSSDRCDSQGLTSFFINKNLISGISCSYMFHFRLKFQIIENK